MNDQCDQFGRFRESSVSARPPEVSGRRPWARRRFLRLVAVTASLGGAAESQAHSGSRLLVPRHWRGKALGAPASVTVYGDNKRLADAALQDVAGEIARLEGVFSLQRSDSALSRLNRTGRLERAPEDLRLLMARARNFNEATGGAFDPSVQPLWELYARHFAAHPGALTGPDASHIEAALQRVNYGEIEIGARGVRFARQGMAVTLNGIAQGYIVDCLGARLRERGLQVGLLDAGELCALGRHPEGRPWSVGVRDPRNPGRFFAHLELDGEALATSAGYGTVFDTAAEHHHLFDPRTGRSAGHYASVSVVHARAATADALSTAFSAMPLAAIERALTGFAPVRVLLLRADGKRVDLSA